MSVKVRGETDDILEAVKSVLEKYAGQHPQADIEIYRQNSVSLRIRIIDTDFARFGPSERHDALWTFLDELPEEILNHLSVLLLLTPEEKERSFANMEFEHPIPSNF